MPALQERARVVQVHLAYGQSSHRAAPGASRRLQRQLAPHRAAVPEPAHRRVHDKLRAVLLTLCRPPRDPGSASWQSSSDRHADRVRVELQCAEAGIVQVRRRIDIEPACIDAEEPGTAEVEVQPDLRSGSERSVELQLSSCQCACRAFIRERGVVESCADIAAYEAVRVEEVILETHGRWHLLELRHLPGFRGRDIVRNGQGGEDFQSPTLGSHVRCCKCHRGTVADLQLRMIARFWLYRMDARAEEPLWRLLRLRGADADTEGQGNSRG